MKLRRFRDIIWTEIRRQRDRDRQPIFTLPRAHHTLQTSVCGVRTPNEITLGPRALANIYANTKNMSNFPSSDITISYDSFAALGTNQGNRQLCKPRAWLKFKSQARSLARLQISSQARSRACPQLRSQAKYQAWLKSRAICCNSETKPNPEPGSKAKPKPCLASTQKPSKTPSLTAIQKPSKIPSLAATQKRSQIPSLATT